MRTIHEFEVREYSKGLPDGKTFKAKGSFNKLDEPGKIINATFTNPCQVTYDDIEEKNPYSYIHIVEYRNDEHVYDQYWIDLDSGK